MDFFEDEIRNYHRKLRTQRGEVARLVLEEATEEMRLEQQAVYEAQLKALDIPTKYAKQLK